ncbi:unnamed protein product [Hydatigera taeniaeformis]|uniref:CSD domain-containing protein n=1 Tax=Hydatigena taeniaeformis TaxID=6205 RepID=A0A0R3WUD6_HYDTA|nr:unnamed protein product [Hydatigera taeniaeformis]
MGLGFCRFVERSRLYSPTGGETGSAEISEQKDGSPAIVATVTTDDHRLVGPGDRVKFFAEVRNGVYHHLLVVFQKSVTV